MYTGKGMGSTDRIELVSQVRYLYHHFNLCKEQSPALISRRGASIMDAKHILNFVSRGVDRLILDLGTNDLATASVSLG
ncbi:hypothetical protein HPB47_025637 [Ixodes persulcatus]|uniref:Uncharacterized protein n=1 Tax=Ixodes persulcatus TaxID=34615 RepID=A0AC60Q258_IXOPE|nr:hypothetical protein HPB47_025637 [Ixodes persulcatus]